MTEASNAERHLRNRAAVRRWLYVVALLVVAMIVLGGATRLTDSGLSITEWQPFMGAIPPLSEADWQAEFLKYQQIPEFALVNSGMTLAEFKTIYWWEWSHRLLGRVIGVVFILPLVFFALHGMIQARVWPRLIVLLLLGAAQGAIGWWMVTSGLVEGIDVSQYRLAIHLLLACIILAYLLWVARGLSPAIEPWNPPSFLTKAVAVLAILLIFDQIYLGGLLAGLDGGLIYNTWPLMDGKLVPDGLLSLEPWWRNFFENIATVQFSHRTGAVLLAVVVLLHAIQAGFGRPDSVYSRRSFALLLLVLLQGGIGIATLLSTVELQLALAHQLLAVGVLALAVVHLRDMTRRIPLPRERDAAPAETPAATATPAAAAAAASAADQSAETTPSPGEPKPDTPPTGT